jgi:TRAP-type C4-dicarboxylate transport system substrate-binding protein
MRRLAGIGAAALAVAILLTATACSGGNKAGGANGQPAIVLTFASQFGSGQPEQLLRFANEVARRSNGTIRIDFRGSWRANDPHQELDTIRDVKAGKVDLAWVGARAWDWVGVKSFDALVAPFLIDSLPLEQKVFAAGIPQRMLRGVRRAAVVGIGVLPGPMRKALGVRRRLVRASDFRGLAFGLQGIVAAETLRALGAHPRQLISGPSLGGLGGIEEQMSAIVGNGHDATARFLSANLNLWPRPLVLFASPKVFHSLSSAQRQALRDAARAAVPEAMAASEQEDAAAATQLCARHGLAFVDLTPPQLEALRKAVGPVYRRLDRDSATLQTIRAVEALSRETPPALPIRCRGGSASSGPQAATPIDGSWQMTATVSALQRSAAYGAYGFTPSQDDFRADAGTYRMTLRDGYFASSLAAQYTPNSSDRGTYRVDGNLVTFHITSGHDLSETWTYIWSIYRDTLTFTRPKHGAQGPPNPTFATWHRVTGSTSVGPLDGVYEVDVSRSDLVRAGDAGDAIPENLGHYVYVFDGGRFAFTQEGARACTWQYGKLGIHGKRMTWDFIDGGAPPAKAPNHGYNHPGDFFEFKWSLYRNTLTLAPVAGATSPTPSFVNPWHRVTTTPSRSYLSKDCPPPAAALP